MHLENGTTHRSHDGVPVSVTLKIANASHDHKIGQSRAPSPLKSMFGDLEFHRIGIGSTLYVEK